MSLYVRLPEDPYSQVSALECILFWYVIIFHLAGVRAHTVARPQDETGRIEDELMRPESIDALLRFFVQAKANSFENLLDPFLKMFRISTNIVIDIDKSFHWSFGR